ncbi:MAG: transketolase [Bifidobacteriaceae bacterium]|jgi:transketolase|nr:transketolase [Bifidobacteriaceae bacterium]
MNPTVVPHVDLPVFGPIPRGTPRADTVRKLAEIARAIRARDAEMIAVAGQGHIGGDYSSLDILTTLYFAVLRLDPANPRDPERDRFVLSKGHAAGSLYTTLAAFGLLDPASLETFMRPLSKLNGHPDRNKVVGVEANTGPLGHGLPIAVGFALAAKLDGSHRRTFVLTGDGELEEGSNWEAMMTAAHHRLENLTIITDVNGLQQGKSTRETTALAPLADKGRAFGMDVVEVPGHDFDALLGAFEAPPSGRPKLVLARTVKGHPISFMSDVVAWHHKVPSPDQVRQIVMELSK